MIKMSIWVEIANLSASFLSMFTGLERGSPAKDGSSMFLITALQQDDEKSPRVGTPIALYSIRISWHREPRTQLSGTKLHTPCKA